MARGYAKILSEAKPFDAPAGVNLESGDVLASLMRQDQLRWLPGDVLAKADRASMGASLELRTPYLSRELAEFAATVSPKVHIQGGGKLLLRRVLQQTLPSAHAARAKVAFRTPCADWLRGPLSPALDRQLAESPLYDEGWFERTTVATWIGAHRAGRADLSGALWPVFALGCWFDAHSPR